MREQETIDSMQAPSSVVGPLPSQTDQDFGPTVRARYKDVEKTKLQALVDSESSVEERFAAFYALQVRRRRDAEYVEHKQAVEAYRHVFAEQPMFLFMVAESYGDLADPGEREIGVAYARRAAEACPNTPGVQHLLAEFLLESVELATTDSHARDAGSLLMEAEQAVASAISLNPKYAKYHATRARILSQMGAHDRALASIVRAIELEDGGKDDGHRRILQYQMLRREIVAAKSLSRARDEQQAAVDEFRSLRSELLSLLGLLAAVVAFISTSATAATNMPLRDGLSLSCVTGAVIVLVFTAFESLFGRSRHLARYIAPAVIAVLLVAGAVVLQLVAP